MLPLLYNYNLLKSIATGSIEDAIIFEGKVCNQFLLVKDHDGQVLCERHIILDTAAI